MAATAVRAEEAGATPVLGELVVTAQHRSENIQKVPISINAFSARDIRKLGIQTSTDIGLVTPNVNIALSQGAGNQPIITIRGIGINDENTNNAGPIAVYVDDVYLSSPAAQTFSTFDLERVEVLKGPQGTLYGRNTSGGAINYVSVKPSDTFSAMGHFSYSSFNTFNIEAAVGGPIAPGLDGRISFLKDNSDGYAFNTLTGQHENGANDWALRGQLLWKPRDDLKFLFNVNGGQIDTRPAQYGHYGDFVPGTQGLASPVLCSVADTMADKCVDLFGYTQPKSYYSGGFNKQAHLKVNSINASARIDWLPGYLTVTSITAFEHNDKIEPEDTDSSPYRELEINWGVKNNTVTQEFRVAHTEAKYNWTGGLYYLHEDLRQNQPLEFLLDYDLFYGPGSGDGFVNRQTDTSHQVTDAIAAFGQGEYNVTDKLKFILGGRFTHEHRTFEYAGTIQVQEGGMDHFGPAVSLLPPGAVIPALNNSNFSWRVAADYSLTSDVLAYASIATGFKSGDFNGGFLSTDPVQALFQLKPIGPETDVAYEIGLKTSWFDHRLVANASVFYTDYSNLQVFSLVQSPNGPLNSLTSAQKAHNVGADFQLTAKPIPALTLTANLGLLDAKIDRFVVPGVGVSSLQGLQLAFSPHVSAFLMADYKVPVGPGTVDFQFSASYKGHQFYDSTNDPYLAQNAYWLENIRVGYEVGRWEVAGSIKNLSNLKYTNDAFDSTGPFGYIQPVWGTPRWYAIELNYRY
ncbi:TonB-dependent receptor [Caulobacter sp. KR2-114]|uniref:TonB-dependent receptor n=1 Tax=Caulobacter sp. KR2-114 TaxID=3400912 RepID=UPI003BFDF921